MISSDFTRKCIPARILLVALIFLFLNTSNDNITNLVLLLTSIASLFGLVMVGYLYMTNSRTGFAGNEKAWWNRPFELFILSSLIIISSISIENKNYRNLIPLLIVIDILVGLYQYRRIQL